MADINLQEVFAKGTRGGVTCDFESTLPFVVRGITKKHLMDQCAECNRDCYYIDTGYLGNFPSVVKNCGIELLKIKCNMMLLEMCQLIDGMH